MSVEPKPWNVCLLARVGQYHWWVISIITHFQIISYSFMASSLQSLAGPWKFLLVCFWKMAQNRKNSTPDQFLGPNFGWDIQNMLLHNSIRQIFDFLIFCRDMASFLQKNSRFWDFHLFTRPYLGKKSKNQKFDG